MILFDLNPTENCIAYEALQISNLNRQYDFLESIVPVALDVNRPYLSQTLIKAFNYHAIVCLHSDAGQIRRCEVELGNNQKAHKPPRMIRVQALLDDFVNDVNYNMSSMDPVFLASWALWRLNWIHPFVNGNGRTARIVAYYIICVRAGGIIKGFPSLPELLRQHRGEKDDPYVAALQAVDQSLSKGSLDIEPVVSLVSDLLNKQLSSESDYS